MPYTTEHKQRSRGKILQCAIACFSNKGYDNTSIDEIMQMADMTRGAFYAHFSSKADLYQQAIITGAQNSQLLCPKPDELSDHEWIIQLVKGYLSEHHVQQELPPCPLAFLVTDVAVREPAVRDTYTHVYKGMNKFCLDSVSRYRTCDEQQIYALTAMLIGAVAIGRAVNNHQLRQEMLGACQNVALAMLDEESLAHSRDAGDMTIERQN